MILIKLSSNIIVNADNIHAITIGEDNSLQLEIEGGLCYSRSYDSPEEAQAAFDKLFMDLAQTPGVDGAVVE